MSDEMKEVVTVRPATEDDKEGILALDPKREIYGGNDYIPGNFDEFIKDPDRTMSVACINGKIVRAQNFFIQ